MSYCGSIRKEVINLEKYNVTVIIPSLNPDEKLLKTVSELEKSGFDDIIIVNDGSDSEHLAFFPDTEEHPCCTVIDHRKNRGKGAALKTAFRYFLNFRENKDGVITIDSDGQHLTEDIIKCVEEMSYTGKVVLGCRNFKLPQVPPRSRFGNRCTSLVFRAFCGLKVSDTQTGLRAIPTEYLPDLIEVRGSRYEYETNMLLEFKKRGIDFVEVPISTVYIDDNKQSHFKPVADSLRIYKLILSFMFSSLLSMFVELVLFYSALHFFFDGAHAILYSTILSRLCSSVLNFTLNRQKVFSSKTGIGRSLVRYTVLAIPLVLASSYSIKGLVWLLGINSDILTTLVKMLVDTILFFVSFRIQQNWVFAPDKKTVKSTRNNGKPVKRKLTVGRIIGRVFISIGTALLYLVVSLVVLLAVVARGPSTTMRDALVLSAMQASATKWVPGLFLSDETVKQIVDNSYVDSKMTISIDNYTSDSDNTEDEFKDAADGIKYIPSNYDNFKAYIMLVPDASRVYVGTSSDNFSSAKEGMRIFALAKKEDAIACINGGEFADAGGVGNGATPIGLTYSDGKCVWNDGSSRTFIGIDSNNRLVVAESMTKAKADELGIRDAVSFQTGNVLIDSDESGVHIHYKEGNTGAAQRTAIGQRADGTFIFVVTDGRTASSIGATYNEVIDIMVSYGAVTAAMLDGGSSAMMYYEDYYEKYDIDKSTLDEYQLQGLTNKYKAFTPPRRIPTYFCVSR